MRDRASCPDPLGGAATFSRWTEEDRVMRLRSHRPASSGKIAGVGSSLARTVGRSLAVGAATGGRSFSGIAAVSLSSSRDERPLGSPVAKVLVGMLAVGELVLDKSPKAPNRLEPPGLAGRIVFGGASAGLLARRHSASPIPQVVVGMAAALTAAFVGHWGRSRLAGRFGADMPGALIEDGVVQSLAWVACLGRAPKEP
jgi:uncharacterized membrane protein